jgi:ankyrin repeat protein
MRYKQAIVFPWLMLLISLTAWGASSEESLFLSVRRGNVAGAQSFLDQGVDVNARDKSGQTPLHNASSKEMAEFLIGRSADLNAKDVRGQTPLHRMVAAGMNSPIETLIARGADINARDNAGQTPLHWAARRGNKDVLLLLLAGGADAKAKDKDGLTPLQVARLSPYGAEVVEILKARN